MHYVPTDGNTKRVSVRDLTARLRFWPWMLGFQLACGLILWLAYRALRNLWVVLMRGEARSAAANGDVLIVFRTWQGWLIIALALAVLAIVAAVDISGLFILSRQILEGGRIRLFSAIGQGFLKVRRFLGVKGIPVIAWLIVMSLMAGLGISLPKTKNFYIPEFITTAVFSSPVLIIAYILGLVILTVLGLRNIFLVPYVVLEDRTVAEASALGHMMFRHRRGPFIRRYVIFIVLSIALPAAAAVILTGLPVLALNLIGLPENVRRFILLLAFYAGAAVLSVFALILIPMLILELTRLFFTYRTGVEVKVPGPGPGPRARPEVILFLAAVGAVFLAAGISVKFFDELYPVSKDIVIVAHRLGGHASVENSLEGEAVSTLLGVYGYETDVQRSGDGVYVINHDNTFRRVYGETRAVSEMDWEEISLLETEDDDGNIIHPASLDEVMNEAQAHLYIELKGPTADIDMCDDVVSLIYERGLQDECTVISMNYPLISYIHNHYEDIRTGYVCYFSVAELDSVDCDIVILQEETAMDEVIFMEHAQGREVYVWTVNSYDSARYFLNSNVDGIITDEMSMCQEMQDQLAQRNDFERIADGLMRVLI